jgi:hypothetical protein
MDSRKTTQGDGDERAAENVVRLPRDWLGPRDELVPIGSRARTADTPEQDPAEPIPPGAASFWSEDSGSLQAPMQAPADAWRGHWDPAPAPAAPPDRPAPTRRHRRLPRPRLPAFLGDRFATYRRRVPVTATGVAAACVVVLLAVIGQTEGGTHNASNKATSSAKNAPIAAGTGANLARLRAITPIVTQIKPQPISHHATGTRARHKRVRIHVTTLRHRGHARRAAQPAHSTSEPVRSTTVTSAPVSTPTTSTPAPTVVPTNSPAASTDRSTSSSGHHQRAFGLNGSLGPGSSPDS